MMMMMMIHLPAADGKQLHIVQVWSYVIYTKQNVGTKLIMFHDEEHDDDEVAYCASLVIRHLYSAKCWN